MTRDFDYITLVSMVIRPKIRAFFLLFLIVSGCSSARKHTHDAPLLPGMSANIPAPVEDSPEDGDALDTQVPDLDSGGGGAATDADEPDDPDVEPHPEAVVRKRQIPFEFNQEVAKWVEYFSQKDRERFQRFFDRGEPYREVIQNILEENHVPTDLYYLGMIESGFNAHAKSSAKAVGVWQFMRTTGKMYGLASDAFVDQRKDPIRATEAAAKMMRDLYRQFHSWYLAMAAYNAGSGRIRGAIRKGRSQDFWELVRRGVLPKETMDYVPKFLAARYIGENPDLFGFYINEEKKYPDVELVRVPAPVTFNAMEAACSIPEGTLTFVNPQYLKGYTHPKGKEDEIWVPEQYRGSIEGRFRDLANLRIRVNPAKASSSGYEPEGRVRILVVKKGDTLKAIAKKRGLSVAYLKRVNGLRTSLIQPGQKLKIAASSYHQRKAHPRTGRKKKMRRS